MNHNPKSKTWTERSRSIQNLKSKWPDLVLLLILSLLPLLFFWRLITPNPADRMHIFDREYGNGGDFAEQYFPLRAFSAQEWVRGQVPLWNPYLYGGQPALADIQSGALYPIHVIEALTLGWGGPLIGYDIGFPLWALELQVVFHFSLAAVGTYLFARHVLRRSGAALRQARFGGVITSIVFIYSGYLTGFPVQQLTILEVSAWLPWILWGLDVALRRNPETIATAKQSSPLRFTFHVLRRSLKPVALTALAFAMAILAGHPQTVLYIFYLSLAYTLFLSIANFYPELGQRNHLPIANVPSATVSEVTPLRPSVSLLYTVIVNLTLWLLIILLGASIAAAQLLPTLEFIAHSVRADLSYQAVSEGLPLNELIAILYPGYFGGSPQYVGIVTLVLIALAFALGKPRRVIFFWAGAGLVSLLLAFGDHLFAYPLFYLLTPGFDSVRQQERAFFIFSFSAAMLAGYGAVVLTTPLSKAARSTYTLFEHRLRIVAAVALGLTAFFIYGATAASARGDEGSLIFGSLRHHVFGLIFLGGMLGLLAVRPKRWLRRWWGMSLIAIWVAFNLFTVNWRFNIEKNPNPFTPNGVVQFLQTTRSFPTGRVASGGLLPGGNSAASIYNLQDLTGNTPLHLDNVNTFLSQMPSWRLWQLMNVRYIVDQRDISDAGLRLVFEEDELKVFEMGDPFERAWFVSETEIIADQQQTIARLAEDGFNLHQAAIVTKLPDTPLDDASDSMVTVIDSGPTHLTIETDTTGQHLLVLSQIYYPGWQSEIDDQPTGVLQVNAIQQGILVPPGKHTVQLTFWPNTFWLGVIISGIGLLICAVVFVIM